MWVIVFCFFRLLVAEKACAESITESARIVNGHYAAAGERPFQAALFGPSFFCGGSVIDNSHILTAAHCLEGKTADTVRVYVGTVDLTRPYKIYQAAELKIHEDYQPENFYINDIGLIRLTNPMQFDIFINAVSLPERNEVPLPGTPVTVSGWGTAGLGIPNQGMSVRLLEATIKVDDPNHCQEQLQEQRANVSDTQLCAYDPDVRTGACTGDSGGPLTSSKTLVGIVSWSFKDPFCASTELPDVYTLVSAYIDWIQKNK